MPRFLGIFTRKSKHNTPDHPAAHPSSNAVPDDLDSPVSTSPTVSCAANVDKASSTASHGRSSLHPDTATRSAHGHSSTPHHGQESQLNGYPGIAASPSAASSNASTSRLRLPFTRKKASNPPAGTTTTGGGAGGSTTSVNTTASGSVQHFSPAPRPSYAERNSVSTTSDGEVTDMRRLRPPPSKSAIFAAYADPTSALSTRSLPNEASPSFLLQDPAYATSMPTSPAPPHVAQPSSSSTSTSNLKRSIFSWTKSGTSPLQITKTRSKSTPPENVEAAPKLEDGGAGTGADLANSSFNLKSFRHVSAAAAANASSCSSPSPLATAASPNLTVPNSSPLTRPRGPSVGESSQRISVAAFREAQARRSLAGSPVPSFRSPSPLLSPGAQESGGRASPRLGPSGIRASASHDARLNGQEQQQKKPKRHFTSDSDMESTSPDESSGNDDDDDDDSDREHTVTQRSAWGKNKVKARAKSEVGHGSSRISAIEAAQVSERRMLEIPPRPQSSLGQYSNGRQRASASASAVSPNAAAKRASVIAAQNSSSGSNGDPAADYKRASRHIRDASVYSNPGGISTSNVSTKAAADLSDSDESDDDAPLATLVPPKRPGSALSTASAGSNPSASGGRNRSNSNLPPPTRTKPLIDINEILGGKGGASAAALPHRATGGVKGELREDKGFTKGRTLLSASASPEPLSLRADVSTSVLSASPLTLSPVDSFATAPSSFMSPPSTAVLINNDSQSHFKRDGLSERLLRVAKNASTNVNLSSNATTPVSTPASSPNLPGTSKSSSPSTVDVAKGTAPVAAAFPRSSFSPRSSVERRNAPAIATVTPATPRRSKDANPVRIGGGGGGLKQLNPSPPDEELISLLGASVRLISRTGESSPEEGPTVPSTDTEESEEETSEEEADDDDGGILRNKKKLSVESSKDEKATDEWEKVDLMDIKDKEDVNGNEKEGAWKGKSVLGIGRDRGRGEKEADVPALAPKVAEPPIAPILIKQRAPTPSFSVTSRPPLIRNGGATTSSGTRTSGASGSGSASLAPSTTSSSSGGGGNVRQRSSTLMSYSLSSSPAMSSLSPAPPSSVSSSDPRGRSSASSAGVSVGNRLSPMGRQGQDSPSITSLNKPASDSSSSLVVGVGGRQRSSTMMSAVNVSGLMPGGMPPLKPFAMRRDSPASSTGDSSSGRVPLTPRDGSDVGSAAGSVAGTVGGGGTRGREGGEGGGSAMKGSGASGLARNIKRRSVCFEDDVRGGSDAASSSSHVSTKGKAMMKGDEEEKRKERRRSEAKAAIELGNVINGRGPVVDDEDDEDMPINQTMQGRMSTMNPMMAMNGGMHPIQMGSMPSWNARWGAGNQHAMAQHQHQQQMMNAGPFMFPGAGPDPGLLAAHQQAMMIAKQAYQMAVAQQAAVAAGDEWERGSVVSGFGGGGGSVYNGGGMGGPPPGYGMPMAGMPMGMGMGMNMNMNMMGMGLGSNWSSNGSAIFPSSRSMYAGMSGARSEYGGGNVGGRGGAANAAAWSSSRSTYGESFGPSGRSGGNGGGGHQGMRESGYYPPVPPLPTQGGQQGSSPGARGGPGGVAASSGARTRTTSQPANRGAGVGIRKAPPPSSWKANNGI